MPPSTDTVLVVDPDPEAQRETVSLLRSLGFSCRSCGTGREALEILERQPFPVVLSETRLPDMDGLLLLQRSQRLPDPPGVLFASAFASLEDAVRARRAGAFDLLPRPLVPEELHLALRRALEQRALREENRRLRQRLAGEQMLDQLVGRDPRMRELFELARTIAPTRATVLISGESGTGKTLLARAIHRLSDRAERPFVVVSCGSLPETLLESELFGHARGAFTGAHRDQVGRFEQADRGTLFLDEIGTASSSLQVKLLRFLQDRSFERVGETRTRQADVRLILATNSDLETLVGQGRFRKDLYYRINVIHLQIPPLRDRPADILPLARHLLQRAARHHGRETPRIPRKAGRRLLAWEWPGNVRELENALERALLLCDGREIRAEHLPGGDEPPPGEPPAVHWRLPDLDPARQYSLKELLREPERMLLEAALRACGGNRERAARLLGINRATLFAKLKRLGLQRRRGKGRS